MGESFFMRPRNRRKKLYMSIFVRNVTPAFLKYHFVKNSPAKPTGTSSRGFCHVSLQGVSGPKIAPTKSACDMHDQQTYSHLVRLVSEAGGGCETGLAQKLDDHMYVPVHHMLLSGHYQPTSLPAVPTYRV